MANSWEDEKGISKNLVSNVISKYDKHLRGQLIRIAIKIGIIFFVLVALNLVYRRNFVISDVIVGDAIFVTVYLVFIIKKAEIKPLSESKILTINERSLIVLFQRDIRRLNKIVGKWWLNNNAGEKEKRVANSLVANKCWMMLKNLHEFEESEKSLMFLNSLAIVDGSKLEEIKDEIKEIESVMKNFQLDRYTTLEEQNIDRPETGVFFS